MVAVFVAITVIVDVVKTFKVTKSFPKLSFRSEKSFSNKDPSKLESTFSVSKTLKKNRMNIGIIYFSK